MGLGKTVQCVSMLGYLRDELNVGGPFLIVVPLSTVPNWIRELQKWLPSANSVVYVGDTKSREVIRHFEFGWDGCGRASGAAGAPPLLPPRTTAFDVLVTTYELVLKDAALLGRVKWSYLVVDEVREKRGERGDGGGGDARARPPPSLPLFPLGPPPEKQQRRPLQRPGRDAL